MKNLIHSKTFDRVSFVCIGILIASVIYFSVNTTDAENEILDTDGLALTSLIINELNHRIIMKKIDVLNSSINSDVTDDLKAEIEWTMKLVDAKLAVANLMVGKNIVGKSRNTTEKTYELIDKTIADINQLAEQRGRDKTGKE